MENCLKTTTTSTAPASPRCNYPACQQLCAQKRDGSLHKKCELHRIQSCKYQMQYTKRKRDEMKEGSNWNQCQRRLFPYPDSPNPQENQRIQSTELIPTVPHAPRPLRMLDPLSLVEECISFALKHRVSGMTGTLQVRVCSYLKCQNARAVGQNRRPRSKCDYHQDKQRRYQQSHRQKVCASEATTEAISPPLPHPHLRTSQLNAIFSGFQALWVSDEAQSLCAMPIRRDAFWCPSQGISGGIPKVGDEDTQPLMQELVSSTGELLDTSEANVLKLLLRMLENDEPKL